MGVGVGERERVIGYIYFGWIWLRERAAVTLSNSFFPLLPFFFFFPFFFRFFTFETSKYFSTADWKELDLEKKITVIIFLKYKK